MLGFSRALGEFGATIVVAGSIPGRTRTLAVGIYSFTETGQDQQAAVLMVISISIAFVAVLASEPPRRDRPEWRPSTSISRCSRASSRSTFSVQVEARALALFGAVGLGQDVGARGRRGTAHAAARPDRGRTATCSFDSERHVNVSGSQPADRIRAAGHPAVSAPRTSARTSSMDCARATGPTLHVLVDLLELSRAHGPASRIIVGRRTPARRNGPRALLRSRRAAARRAAGSRRPSAPPPHRRRAARHSRRAVGAA